MARPLVSNPLRRDVLRMFRQILKVSRTWEAFSKQDTCTEREYIKDEARTLFRQNMQITDPEEIKLCLEEASSRLEIALHYQNPYPRPVNVPMNYVSKSRDKKGIARKTKQSKPVYIYSQSTEQTK